MKLECDRITRNILPAVRASIAETMSYKYNYKQEEIAEKLGVVQVAVSKYLNKRYSKEVGKVKSYITENNMNIDVVSDIVSGRGNEEINKEIEKLCMTIAVNYK